MFPILFVIVGITIFIVGITIFIIFGIIIHKRNKQLMRISVDEAQSEVAGVQHYEESQETDLGTKEHCQQSNTRPCYQDGDNLQKIMEESHDVEKEFVIAKNLQENIIEESQSISLEEIQLKTVLESPTGVTQDPQVAIVAETQPTAVGELCPPVVQETQPTIGREMQLQVAGQESPPSITQRAQPTSKSERLEPAERGGRSRVSIRDPKKRLTANPKPRTPKPEIVCWKRERQWIPAVEVPEELLESSDLAVFQNGQSLTKDESRDACWHLTQVTGEVTVRWSEGENARETKVSLGQGNYLLFKLSSDQNWGRRVQSPSSGSYLVTVPDDWERDEALSGPPPVTPEFVSLKDYRAHFFELERGSEKKIAFRTSEGKSVIIESKESRFKLIGNRLPAASENIGPLFGGNPPQICAMDVQAWKDVGTIVVGEEGSGKGRWRMAFTPEQGLIEQTLPPEVGERKEGWYFLRFYDTNGDLVESLDFRFISALKEIRTDRFSPLPLENGYNPVCVTFLHDPGCVIHLADGSLNVQIERQDDKTILTIPPDPTCDKTHWHVGSQGGPQVEVTILVERLWWAIGEENQEPTEWRDRPLTLKRGDFAATSKKALWIRFPRYRWVDRIRVGFEQTKARTYNVMVTAKTITVPLREFSDSIVIRDGTETCSLKVWIKRDDDLTEGVIAVIPAVQLTVTPAPEQMQSAPTPSWVGLGRKKTAVAKAVLREGSGPIKVNGQNILDYFGKAPDKAKQFLMKLLEMTDVRQVLARMEASVNVTGSNPTTTRQAKAVAHALARALMSYNPHLKSLLKRYGFGGVRVKSSFVFPQER
ncbi:MAG: uS9 family ribosomal protein [Thermogemmata sp.]|uniref:Small ribosomal subunit protein uS9 n=1 Tax=Thermogemmata fonticola TaxID=2755323 RepID=A0A7V8VEV6_9BACT|nr:uS9 family ribosomal protein [Thermogemmata fonticola]MBA2226681.1 mitochondrial small ribosomal subunit protein uS9m [Thermogemmata fonticola]